MAARITLEGKVAIVTGGSRGIGEAIARTFVAHGARVVIASRKADGVAAAVEAIAKDHGPERIAGFAAHAGKEDECIGLVRQAAERFGPIDVLVNNAGVYEFGPIEAVTPEHFHKQFNVNVLGLILTTQAALQNFSPAGGSIINIGSVAAKGVPTGSVYSATKGAVDSVTLSLSKELGARNIRVNSLNPGMVETEGVHAAGIIGSDFQKKTEAETPLGRIGQPDDIATVAAFLASDDSAWLTGQTIQASGGARL
jgi:3-oxoacyl-[acyl-carrier protein] reductase